MGIIWPHEKFSPLERYGGGGEGWVSLPLGAMPRVTVKGLIFRINYFSVQNDLWISWLVGGEKDLYQYQHCRDPS